VIDILEASFLKSASKISQSPEDSVLEVAFMGRSNVGKSSLINSILNRNGLAKSSNTPGKTQLINFFNAKFRERESRDEVEFRIVDLPGVGYARVSKTQKADWEERLNTFISKRENITTFLYLIDSRHPNLDIDRGVIDYLESILKPHQRVVKVFTKVDKLKKSQLNAIKSKNRGESFISNLKGTGRDELQKKLFNIVKGDEIVV
jgi:GTP-binding protein